MEGWLDASLLNIPRELKVDWKFHLWIDPFLNELDQTPTPYKCMESFFDLLYRSQFMGKSVGLNSELTRNVGVSVQQAGSLKEMKLGEK